MEVIKEVLGWLGIVSELFCSWVILRHLYGMEFIWYRKNREEQAKQGGFLQRVSCVKPMLVISIILYFLGMIGICHILSGEGYFLKNYTNGAATSEENTYDTILVVLGILGFFLTTARKKSLGRVVWIWNGIVTCEMPMMVLALFMIPWNIHFIDTAFFMGTGYSELVSLIFCILILCMNRKYGFSKRIQRKEKAVVAGIANGIFVLLILVTIVCSFWQDANFQDKKQIGARFFIELVAILVVILLVLLIRSIIIGVESDYYEKVSLVNEKRAKESLEFYTSYREAQEETRKLRHDMKNHVACMQILAEDGKWQELRNYINEMDTQVAKISMVYQSGNEIVDAVLQLKGKTACEAGITISLNGQLPPMPKVDAIDWCKIFANAIDNGIEALTQCQGIEKQLQISIQQKGHFLAIRFENPCKNWVSIRNNKVETSKQEKELHGYGLENIRQAVQKYNGEMELSCQERDGGYAFIVGILLPIASEKV